MGKHLSAYYFDRVFIFSGVKNGFQIVNTDKIKISVTATGKWKFSGDKHYTIMVDQRLSFWGAKYPEIFNIITHAVRILCESKDLRGLSFI
jgi:hypothetical protein